MTKPVIDGPGWYVRRDERIMWVDAAGPNIYPWRSGATKNGPKPIRYEAHGRYSCQSGNLDIIRRATPTEIEAHKALNVGEG